MTEPMAISCTSVRESASPRSGYNDSTKLAILTLKALNPGSGGEIPAIWHGTGACHCHIYPKTLVLKARLLVLSLYPERPNIPSTERATIRAAILS